MPDWNLLSPSVVWLGFASILPWSLALVFLFPRQKWKVSVGKLALIVILSLVLGYVATEVILELHPKIFKELPQKLSKRPTSLLTQTAHIAFIQAGMLEETFKILLIITLGYFLGMDKSRRNWTPPIFLIAGFVALGFSLVENIQYFFKADESRFWETVIGRTIHSSNIHLLINLCFALFLLKSNAKKGLEKTVLLSFAFFHAVFQHGVVDFFLIPGSKFGVWVSTALFVGIWVWVVRDYRVWILEIPPKKGLGEGMGQNRLGSIH